jgi:hypothetical protein
MQIPLHVPIHMHITSNMLLSVLSVNAWYIGNIYYLFLNCLYVVFLWISFEPRVQVKLRDCIKGAFITCIVVVSEVLLKVHLKIRLVDGFESTAYEGFHSFKIVQKFN